MLWTAGQGGGPDAPWRERFPAAAAARVPAGRRQSSGFEQDRRVGECTEASECDGERVDVGEAGWGMQKRWWNPVD